MLERRAPLSKGVGELRIRLTARCLFFNPLVQSYSIECLPRGVKFELSGGLISSKLPINNNSMATLRI